MRHASFMLLMLSGVMAFAAPPVQESVSPVLGPKLFRDGDVIEITDVTATSQRLEQGDSITVKGRARLQSCQSAKLCLFLTQTESSGSRESDACQSVNVTQGSQDFELKMTIQHRGVAHLTFYDLDSGKPFGGTYFGTAQQMQKIEKWDLSYYLKR